MKRDGRIFDHQTLEAIRLMAIERVREGESPADVIASYGFNRTTIYKWLNAAARSGDEALRSTPATGRPRRLTPAQEQQVSRWVNGRDPRQYGLDFGLWTRAIMAQLIEQKFGIKLGLTAVGKLLAKLGLTPQKLLQRAYQHDPEAIEQWQRERYPALARQARQEKADIFFWDESGFRADAVHGKTWGVRGQTPVVERPGQRQSISAASAVSAKGGFWFCTPAVLAAQICCSANSGLVANATDSGTPAARRRLASSHHSCGRYSRHAIGMLAAAVASDRLTATWQLSCLPSCPQYCRATPTECVPFLGVPVSSITQNHWGSPRAICG
jgi:transposase